MPYFTSAEEWQRQSALLLQARPSTVRPALYTIPLTLHLSELTLSSYTTDAHNNKIPHSLCLFNLSKTLHHHRCDNHNHSNINNRCQNTNRLPRTQNLRSKLGHNTKIQDGQGSRSRAFDCCNGHFGKGNGRSARDETRYFLEQAHSVVYADHDKYRSCHARCTG
jgi:hypothetical protein